jgi:hypothetical protein
LLIVLPAPRELRNSANAKGMLVAALRNQGSFEHLAEVHRRSAAARQLVGRLTAEREVRRQPCQPCGYRWQHACRRSRVGERQRDAEDQHVHRGAASSQLDRRVDPQARSRALDGAETT